jgi:hypothetical protein
MLASTGAAVVALVLMLAAQLVQPNFARPIPQRNLDRELPG